MKPVNNLVSHIVANRWLKWSLVLVAIFVILVIASLIANLWINDVYQSRFLKGTKVGTIDIGGMTDEEARNQIDKRIDFINHRGFVYVTPAKTVTIYPNVSAIDSPDSISSLVSWDIDRSLKYVNDFEKNENFFYLPQKLMILLKGKDFPLSYRWDRNQYQEALANSFAGSFPDKKEASFKIIADNILISSEQAGQTFDYNKALKATQNLIEALASTDINLQVIADVPQVTTRVLESKKSDILKMTRRGDLTLLWQDKLWLVPNDQWTRWLKVKVKDKNFVVGLDEITFDTYLKDAGIKEQLELPVKEAKFELKDGRVSEFVASQEGRAIDIKTTIENLEKLLAGSGEFKIDLAVTVVEPQVSNQDVNDLGIVEIIGTGQSDFKGSPPNRIFNIGVGAAALNGVLIAPGENFSLVKALGEIDGEHGYKQELVIKGNRTIPEFGGGLCQIGTTVFRAALASGLPITERRNHSYRVVYYEPAGMDATIYNPWPDLKFINDTGKHILMQTRIEGTKIYFDFWGTKDGRVAMTTEPVIYNIVAPAPKKIIKTTDLEPGKTKCTEGAHNGADAKFDYRVQYPNQAEPKEMTFYSHYVPWQAVCLLGVTPEELAAEQDVQNATTTVPLNP